MNDVIIVICSIIISCFIYIVGGTATFVYVWSLYERRFNPETTSWLSLITGATWIVSVPILVIVFAITIPVDALIRAIKEMKRKGIK